MEKQVLHARYKRISPFLNEQSGRLWCANEAIALPSGGISFVSLATGVSRTTITEGVKEINGTKELPKQGIRRKGGGRTLQTKKGQKLSEDIESLVEAETRGDPESPLRWCSKSTRKIAGELNAVRHRASHALVSRVLTSLEFSLQANRKTIEGTKDNPDRDAQFRFINKKTKLFQAQQYPVVSVDCKKKENIGNFKNNGVEYRKKGKPAEVNVYDFIDKTKGKVAPYGIYDLTKNNGWVSVGISSDTAAFAVNALRDWYYGMGISEYRHAKELLITADCGGSNGYRVKLWKIELQKFATEINKTINVCHFPPGTSKWNKIEHKLFSFISKNWRGEPLVDRATVVNLIGKTTTTKGLVVRSQLDEHIYEKGIRISDKDLQAINLSRDEFHGEWNYWISP